MAVTLLKFLVKVPTQESIDAAFVILNTCGHKLIESNKKEVNKLLNGVHNTAVYNNIRFSEKVNVRVDALKVSKCNFKNFITLICYFYIPNNVI